MKIEITEHQSTVFTNQINLVKSLQESIQQANLFLQKENEKLSSMLEVVCSELPRDEKYDVSVIGNELILSKID